MVSECERCGLSKTHWITFVKNDAYILNSKVNNPRIKGGELGTDSSAKDSPPSGDANVLSDDGDKNG